MAKIHVVKIQVVKIRSDCRKAAFVRNNNYLWHFVATPSKAYGLPY